MNIHQHTQQLFDAVTARLEHIQIEGGTLGLDENNECFLTLDERMVFMFYLDEEIDALIINLPLGLLPDDDTREVVMQELLYGNYCWNQTEGATLGVDKKTQVISLGYLVPLPLKDVAQMPHILEKLGGVATHWFRIMDQIAEEQSGGSGHTEHAHAMRL